MEVIDESWKPLVKFPLLYEVSDWGRIRNAKSKKIKTIAITYQGYCTVNLSYKNRTVIQRVHRAVAQAFIPNPENKCDVNHIDGNPLNNYIKNLEWATRKENIQHAFRTGLVPISRGEDTTGAKLKEVDILEIRFLSHHGIRTKTLSDVFGVSVMCILAIINRETWTHI